MAPTLVELYRTLLQRYGTSAAPDTWWPLTHSTEPIEWVRVVHAALSVNSSWKLIVAGTESLARQHLLQAAAVAARSTDELAAIIVGGLSKQKAQRLLQLCVLALRFGSETQFLQQVQREELLALPAIKEETADRILLYAAQRPVFPIDRHVEVVFDAYGLVPRRAKGTQRQALVFAAFGDDVESYQRLYAICQLESARQRKGL